MSSKFDKIGYYRGGAKLSQCKASDDVFFLDLRLGPTDGCLHGKGGVGELVAEKPAEHKDLAKGADRDC